MGKEIDKDRGAEKNFQYWIIAYFISERYQMFILLPIILQENEHKEPIILWSEGFNIIVTCYLQYLSYIHP